MDMKDFNISARKKKLLLGIVLALVVLFLLLALKSCSSNTTKDKEAYVNYLRQSLDLSDQNGDHLLDYLDSIGSGLVDCEEDVARQIEAFAQAFKEESLRYHGLTYNGDEVIIGIENYHHLSKIYDEIGDHLEKLALSIYHKDHSQVSQQLESLKESFKQIHTENS